jgi:hypothetical protein
METILKGSVKAKEEKERRRWTKMMKKGHCWRAPNQDPLRLEEMIARI